MQLGHRFRRCSNYIFMFDLITAINGLGKDNCKTRRETLKFSDLVRLISEILRYMWFNNSKLSEKISGASSGALWQMPGSQGKAICICGNQVGVYSIVLNSSIMKNHQYFDCIAVLRNYKSVRGPLRIIGVSSQVLRLITLNQIIRITCKTY